MLRRRRFDADRRWGTLSAIRYSIADQQTKLEQARLAGAEQTEISGFERI
jgi:hypothetical protein